MIFEKVIEWFFFIDYVGVLIIGYVMLEGIILINLEIFNFFVFFLLV